MHNQSGNWVFNDIGKALILRESKDPKHQQAYVDPVEFVHSTDHASPPQRDEFRREGTQQHLS